MEDQMVCTVVISGSVAGAQALHRIINDATQLCTVLAAMENAVGETVLQLGEGNHCFSVALSLEPIEDLSENEETYVDFFIEDFDECHPDYPAIPLG